MPNRNRAAALLAALAVTPVGQGWAHDIADYLQGLT
jgi:hypothetical protein